jgi:diamine N-acetyltransferase
MAQDWINITLQGTYVRLRPLRVDDAEITLRWRLGDRAMLLSRGSETVAEQAAWIANRPNSELNFVIELHSGEPVGMLSLVAIDRINERAEPARFLIGEPDAVKGLPVAVEAMKLLYGFVFDDLRLRRVYGSIAADNVLMIKWQKFLGMKEEGRLRQHYRTGLGFQDAILLGLIEEDYRRVTLPRMNAFIHAAELHASSTSTKDTP